MLNIPKVSRRFSSEECLEHREDYDEERREFNRQIENFRQAGYQKEILSFFTNKQSDFIENAQKLNTNNECKDGTFNFLLVIPKTFKSIYDQMSPLGTVAQNINPSEVFDIVACPNKPYCLYGVDAGLGEISGLQSVGELMSKNGQKLGLTDVEIISLLIQFPDIGKYQVFATGSRVGKAVLPFLKTNAGKKKMMSATDSYRGCGLMEDAIIVPSCYSRSL